MSTVFIYLCISKLRWTRNTGCEADLIPNEGRIFEQYMRSLPIHHREKCLLQIFSGNSGLESKKRLECSPNWQHVTPKNDWMTFYLSLRTIGQKSAVGWQFLILNGILCQELITSKLVFKFYMCPTYIISSRN